MERTSTNGPVPGDRAPGAGAPQAARLVELGSAEHVVQTLARMGGALFGPPRARVAVVPLPLADGLPLAPSAARVELRASVTAYVRTLRRSGAPPERVLVMVKAVLHRAAHRVLEPWTYRALVDEVVRWTIAAYYDPPGDGR